MGSGRNGLGQDGEGSDAPIRRPSSDAPRHANSDACTPRRLRASGSGDVELGGDEVDGIAADHDIERRGLNDAPHLAVEIRELFGTESEVDCLCLAWVEGDAAESAELFHGARDETVFLVDVELDDFIAADAAGVGDVDRDFRGAERADGAGRHFEIRIFEVGIAETPAERIKRKRGRAKIFAVRGRLLIVVVGELADGARNGYWQTSRGIVVAEEDVGHGGAAFLAEIKAIENGGNVLGEEVDGIGTAMLEEDDDRLACGENGFGEIILIAEKVEVVAIAGMIDGPGFA